MAEAQKALAAIDPSTAVTIDRTAYVAGRSSYQVLLTPKDSRSLIGSVRIALDSATSMPLRVQVFAAGAANPAIQVGFTDVHFGAPNASVFDFVKPAGTTVKPMSNPLTGDLRAQAALPPGMKAMRQGAKAKLAAGAADATKTDTATKVIGSGWTAVVESSMPTLSAPAGLPKAPAGSGPVHVRSNLNGLLNQLSTPVAGGRVITSALLTVLITDDGRVLVGPVSTAALQKVATTGKAL